MIIFFIYDIMELINIQGVVKLLQSILQLFPQAIIDPEHSLIKSNYHFLTIEHRTLAIPKNQITENELILLNLMSEQSDKKIPFKKSHWQLFLDKESNNTPIITGDLQVVHFNFKKLVTTVDTDLWFHTLVESIDSALEWFPINAQRFSVLFKIKPNTELDLEQLLGIITSLNSDFETDAQAIIGFQHALSSTLPSKYQEELELVNQSFQLEFVGTLSPLTPVLLRQIGKKTIQEMPLLAPLKQLITSSSEYSSLIEALVANQGNLSQTADKLFIHRNTLTYRLQKFHKESGLQLQYLPDLMICFLCLP